VRRHGDDDTFWVVARFASGEVDLTDAGSALGHDLRGVHLDVVLDTEHSEFAADPHAIDVSAMPAATILRFARPGAIVLKS
jgi:hypothetical protein